MPLKGEQFWGTICSLAFYPNNKKPEPKQTPSDHMLPYDMLTNFKLYACMSTLEQLPQEGRVV